MSAKLHELGLAEGERVVQRKAAGAAHRATAGRSLEADHDGGLAQLFRDLSGDDADYARVPAVAGEHDAAELGHARFTDVFQRFGKHLGLDRATTELNLLDRRRQ